MDEYHDDAGMKGARLNDARINGAAVKLESVIELMLMEFVYKSGRDISVKVGPDYKVKITVKPLEMAGMADEGEG